MENQPDLQEVPDAYACPLGGNIMDDPVVDKDGFSYDRGEHARQLRPRIVWSQHGWVVLVFFCFHRKSTANIEQWLRQHATSPMTRSPLHIHDLRPNRALKETIEAWQKACAGVRYRNRARRALQEEPVLLSFTQETRAAQPGATLVRGVVKVSTGQSEGMVRTPADICVVLDRSGSMEGPSLAESKTAISMLVDALHAQDTLSMVIYDNVADLLFEHKGPGCRDEMKQHIEKVKARGGTNIGIGLVRGATTLGVVSQRAAAIAAGQTVCVMRFESQATDEPLTMGAESSKPDANAPNVRWTLRVDQGSGVQVESVEYTLHPSFEPSHVCLPAAEPLIRVGWGVFEIRCRLRFVDGSFADCVVPMSFQRKVAVNVLERDRKNIPKIANGDAAAAQARVKRIFLFSDGQVNEGLTAPELQDLAGELAELGCSLFTFGLGKGYNEDLMIGMAKRGRGEMTHIQHALNIQQYVADAFSHLSSTMGTGAVLRLGGTHLAVKRVLSRELQPDGTLALHDLKCDDTVFVGVELALEEGAQWPPTLTAELSFTPQGTQELSVTRASFGLVFTADESISSARNHTAAAILMVLEASELDKQVQVLIDKKQRKEAVAVKEKVVALLTMAAELDPTGVAPAYLAADVKALKILQDRSNDDAEVRKASAYTSYSKSGCSAGYSRKMNGYAMEDDDD